MKTLILYVTSHGATADCAHRLASALGGDADICEMKRFFDDISRYDCVIVGAPVYGGRVPKTIREWCGKNLGALCGKPFGVFFSCLSESDQTVQEYLRRNFPRELSGHAFACDSFGGAFYFTRLNALERAIDRSLAASYAKTNEIPAPDGKSDFIMISDRKIAAFAEKVKKIGEKSE